MLTWKWPTWPSAMWPRTWTTSNQSRPAQVEAARVIAVPDGLIDAVRGGADDLGDAIDVIAHGGSLRCEGGLTLARRSVD